MLVIDPGFARIVKERDGRGSLGVCPLELRQHIGDGRAPKAVVSDALGLINPCDPPTGTFDPFKLSELEEVPGYSFFHALCSCYCFAGLLLGAFFLGTRGFQCGEGMWASLKAARTFLTIAGFAAERSSRSPMSVVTS